MNAVNNKPNVYAINCKKMQSLSLIQFNRMRFLILKCSQRLPPCTLYKLKGSCRLIHGIAQGIVYRRKYWLITQEVVAPSRHDWKIVDWDVNPQHKQTNKQASSICPHVRESAPRPLYSSSCQSAIWLSHTIWTDPKFCASKHVKSTNEGC